MSGPRLSVLVLGLGGNVSQGIVKAIRMSSLDCRVVGACISPLSAGLYFVDSRHVSPRADDPGFAGWLTTLCRAEAIDAVLSGAEPVLEALTRLAPALLAETGSRVVVSPPEVMEIGADKLATSRWLAAQDLAAPAFAAADDAAAVEALVSSTGFADGGRLVAKPRRGRGSEGVRLLTSARELDALRGDGEMLLQEHVGSDGDEYTVGVFCDGAGAVMGSAAIRRRLTAGTSTTMTLGDFPEVRREAERVAAALRPTGPVNVQSRLHHGRPLTFEVNVRFSGTTPVRAHFGFNEVDAALRHFVLGEPAVPMPAPTSGVAARYWEEVYIDDVVTA